MKVHGYASMVHYARHVRPVLDALPDDVRGEMFAPWERPWGAKLPRDTPQGLYIVAGYSDAQALWNRRLVYVEHGAGQQYVTGIGAGHPSYSGGVSAVFNRVALFVCPSERVAARWRARYDGRSVAVGAPCLDYWHSGDAPRPHARTVAVTFHWDCNLVPETRWAFPHYERALSGLARLRDVHLLGHGHPRALHRLTHVWERLSVEVARTPDEVMDRADLLVADNTSLLYEFASTGRPVLCLNAPWYRRDVEHGLRFWSHVPGLQVDRPDDLIEGVSTALKDSPELVLQRSAAVAEAYAHVDGLAASRAAVAILEVVSAEPESAPYQSARRRSGRIGVGDAIAAARAARGDVRRDDRGS